MRSVWVLVGLLAWLPAPVAGAVQLQELPLKRALPPLPPGPCEAVALDFDPSVPGSAEALAQSERLAAEANQAAILGDNVRGRALLREAVRLDPAEPALRYRLARLLDDTGEEAEALEEYCRYLMVAPEGPEVGTVRTRLTDDPRTVERARVEEAHQAIRSGIAAFDAGDPEGAAQQFSRALLVEEDWDLAHYNRGVAYLVAGRDAAAEADLAWYLELRSDAEDRGLVEARLQALQPTIPSPYNPRTALLSGIVLPGMGHFYSGRPGTGAILLAAAGGSAAAALLYRKVEVACLAPPVNGSCPVGQVASRTETRPLLVPGLATAVAVTVGGAIHAYLGTRDRAFPAAAALLTPDGLRLGATESSSPGMASLHLEPVPLPGGSGWRARAQLRF